MTLREQTMKGLVWTGGAKLLLQGLQFILTIILARLLSRDDFGLIGMAAILTTAIVMVNERGLGSAIVQRKNIEERHLSSSFWAGIVFGVVLFLLSFPLAYAMSVFFRNPKVLPIVIWMATSFIIGSAGIVQKSLLTRALDFRTLALADVIGVLISGIVSVIMAFMGMGVWSLVWSAVLKDTITGIYLWIFVSWKPRFYFDWQSFRELFGFGANVLANNTAIYAITNIDYLIIGRTLGAAALGVYSLALNIVKLPIYRFSAIISKVTFPAFSVLQNDLTRFQAGYVQSLKYIALVTFPLFIGLGLLAPELIPVFYGEKWLSMVLPMQILCPMGLLKSVGTTKGSVLLARGRADIEFYWNLIFIIPLGAALVWASQFGLVAVTLAYTSVYIIGFPIIQGITNRQIALRWGTYFKAFEPALLASGAMLLVLSASRLVNHQFRIFNAVEFLILGVILGGGSYGLALYLSNKKIFRELMALLGKKEPRNGLTGKTSVTGRKSCSQAGS